MRLKVRGVIALGSLIVSVALTSGALALGSWPASIRLVGSLCAAGSEGEILRDYGQAPEFTGIETWLNSEPLLMKDLRGKVVLVDFWTFACVNCARTLPHVARWYDLYRRQGLVIVGVHTPEFPFERETANLKAAVERFGIRYPVAQDNRYATWKAYSNHYWPAVYLIDRKGTIVLVHTGEGNYEEIENAIRIALGAEPSTADVPDKDP